MIAYGRRLTVALSALLVIAAATGAGVAYSIGHGSIAGTGVAADGAGDPAGSSTSLPDKSGATASTRDGVSSSTATSAGDRVAVALSPSAENSLYAAEVVDLIERYFTAINRGDYDAWLATVSTGQSKRDRDSWTTDYSTTRDSDVYVSDITPGDPLTVRMQFVSHQSLEFAPAALPATCVRWDVTYKILDEGVGLRVDTSAKKPSLAPC